MYAEEGGLLSLIQNGCLDSLGMCSSKDVFSPIQMLSLLTNLQRCADLSSLQLDPEVLQIFTSLCSLPPQDWYRLMVLSAQHMRMEDVMYKVNLMTSSRIEVQQTGRRC